MQGVGALPPPHRAQPGTATLLSAPHVPLQCPAATCLRHVAFRRFWEECCTERLGAPAPGREAHPPGLQAQVHEWMRGVFGGEGRERSQSFGM